MPSPFGVLYLFDKKTTTGVSPLRAAGQGLGGSWAGTAGSPAQNLLGVVFGGDDTLPHPYLNFTLVLPPTSKTSMTNDAGQEILPHHDNTRSIGYESRGTDGRTSHQTPRRTTLPASGVSFAIEVGTGKTG